MMNRQATSNLRQRALRIAVASFLSSSFSDEELLEISVLLDVSFVEDLSHLLTIMQVLQSPRQAISAGSLSDDQPSMVIDAIHDVVRRKRIGKNRLLGYMHEVSPSASRNIASDGISTIQMISEFVAMTPTDQAYRLLMRVSGESDDDPYLKGISRRFDP